MVMVMVFNKLFAIFTHQNIILLTKKYVQNLLTFDYFLLEKNIYHQFMDLFNIKKN